MSLGSALYRLRKARGWTQDELSRLSGISGANISRLEHGQNEHVAAVTLSKLAQALRVDVRELHQAAGWYTSPPEVLAQQSDQPSLEERELIHAIRCVPARSLRERLLRILIDIVNLIRSADTEQERLNGLHLSAEWPGEYEPGQDT